MGTESVVAALARRWWAVVAFVLLGVLAGAVPSPSSAADRATVWSASHTLLLSDAASSDPATASRLFNQLRLFAVAGEVPKRVATQLGYTATPASLAAQVTVEVDPLSGALRIATVQSTPEAAVSIADAFADQLTTYLAEREDKLISDRLADTVKRLDDLKAKVAAAQAKIDATPGDTLTAAELDALNRQYSVVFGQYDQLQGQQGTSKLITLETAQPIEVRPKGLSAPTSRFSRGLLGGAVGVMIGIGAALLLSRIDRRVRTRAQAEAIFGLQSQIAIPNVSKKINSPIVVVAGRHDSLSDAYRTLRNVVGFVEGGVAVAEQRGLVTLVVSPGSGDGKTSVSLNLAAAFAESGLDTIAVNTDFRRPALSERLLGEMPSSLAGRATAAAWLPLEDLIRNTRIERLSLFDLAGIEGPPGQLARITSGRVHELSAAAGAVVIDTSPVGATAEVLELVPHADVIVIVVRLDSTSVEAATRTIEILRVLTEAHLLLVIIGESRERSKYYDDYAQAPPRAARASHPAVG